MISMIYARAWDKSSFLFYSGGKQVEKICESKKSWLSLSILNNRKLRTFHLKDDNSKLWVEVIIVTFLDAEVTGDVLTASDDVNLVEK